MEPSRLAGHPEIDGRAKMAKWKCRYIEPIFLHVIHQILPSSAKVNLRWKSEDL